MLMVFEITAFKHVARTSVNSDENTFYRQSACSQTVLRFHICLREMLSNSLSLGLIGYYDESAALLISAVFLTLEHVDSPKLV